MAATAVPHDPAPTTPTRMVATVPTAGGSRRQSLTRAPRTASLMTVSDRGANHTYVLDTCVLLADPSALFRFEEHDVVLPLVVIEELDRKKMLMNEVHRPTVGWPLPWRFPLAARCGSR